MKNKEVETKTTLFIQDFHRKVGTENFTSADFAKELAANKVNRVLVFFMEKAGVVKRVSRGVYQFDGAPSDKACHVVYELQTNYRSKRRKSKTAKNKAVTPPHTRTDTLPFPSITEDEAVQFLKGKGYKILKPTTEFKEI